MSYWKGLMLAAAIDLVWIAGCPLVTGPELPSEAQWSMSTESAVSYVDEKLDELGRLEDSLMTYLKGHPKDVMVMEDVAHLYVGQGWYEAAIGPLARALQLDPTRRSLWVALDEAIEKSGRGSMSDAELVLKAKAFVEAVEMWGEGC